MLEPNIVAITFFSGEEIKTIKASELVNLGLGSYEYTKNSFVIKLNAAKMNQYAAKYNMPGMGL